MQAGTMGLYETWINRDRQDEKYVSPSEIRGILYKGEEYTAAEYTDIFFDNAERYVREDKNALQAFGTIDQINKRRTAVRDNIDKYIEKSRPLNLWSAKETFIRMEYGRYISYEDMDIDYNHTLAAALWLLDQLYMRDQIHKIHEFLPSSSLDITNEWTPQDFYHPCYTNDLINSVAQVINDHHYKKQFESILEFIPEDRTAAAENRFKALHEKAIDAYLQATAVFDKDKHRIAGELERLSSARNMLVMSSEVDEKSINELSLELKENDDQRKEFQAEFWWHYGEREEHIMKRRKLARLMAVEIEDPYEICFGFALLYAKDDPSLRLESSGCAVLHAACRMLPWYEYLYPYEGNESFSGMTYTDGGWLEQEQPEDTEELYHFFEKDGLNPAQRIYRLSKGIVPFGKHPFERDKQRMLEKEINGSEYIAAWAEILFLSSTRLGAVNFILEDDESEEDDPEETQDAVEEPVKTEISADDPAEHDKEQLAELEDLRGKLNALQKQNKALRTAIAEAKRKHRTEQEKAEKEIRALRMEHRELADLRELVFNQSRDGKNISRKTGPEIEFPYTPKLRTVVFGGHDSFLREIRQKLPDITYVSTRLYNFDPNIIRNADVVWIQNNAISHPQYWRVIRISKIYGVQIRYFAYASAEKCAVQLVTEDSKRYT